MPVSLPSPFLSLAVKVDETLNEQQRSIMSSVTTWLSEQTNRKIGKFVHSKYLGRCGCSELFEDSPQSRHYTREKNGCEARCEREIRNSGAVSHEEQKHPRPGQMSM